MHWKHVWSASEHALQSETEQPHVWFEVLRFDVQFPVRVELLLAVVEATVVAVGARVVDVDRGVGVGVDDDWLVNAHSWEKSETPDTDRAANSALTEGETETS